jgi:hypothetical protein
VNLNIGLWWDGTLTHLKQPCILPYGNAQRNPFVVAISIQFLRKDGEFGIFTTVEIPPAMGISKSTNGFYSSMRPLSRLSNINVIFGEIDSPTDPVRTLIDHKMLKSN